MHKLKLFGATMAVALTLGCGSSLAATYSATSAVGNGANHSLWIQGGLGGAIGSDFDFDPAGEFWINESTGVGGLDGTVWSQDVGTAGFTVDFNYDLSEAKDSNGDPFTPTFKSENGSAPGADIAYTYLKDGSLTGVGDLAGLYMTVKAKPEFGTAAVQYGSAPLDPPGTEGPNNKNDNRGLAHWFTIKTVSCSGDICATIRDLVGVQGDINIDIVQTSSGIPAPVPIPAALPLLLSALGFFGFVGWRRKKTAA